MARPSSPCSDPHCFNLKPCATHPSTPFANAQRSTNLYDTPGWRRERNAFLREHPSCVDCGHHASTVDHEPPHRGDAQLFWDRSTWRPMCRNCHNVKTGRETRARAAGRAR